MTFMTSIPANAPVVVISPHLDDGVFGCGELLAARPGSVVITALAGRPASYGALTAWDAASGFRQGQDVVAARRAEDQAALGVLGARPVWLDYCDAQYENSPSPQALAAAIEAAIRGTGLSTVCFPLGLFHSDHHLTSDAALRVLHRLPLLAWYAYADAIYRAIPSLLEAQVQALRESEVALSPLTSSSHQEHLQQKRRAIARYRSQLRALALPGHPGYEDAFRPEQFWRVTVPALAASAPAEGREHDGKAI